MASFELLGGESFDNVGGQLCLFEKFIVGDPLPVAVSLSICGVANAVVLGVIQLANSKSPFVRL